MPQRLAGACLSMFNLRVSFVFCRLESERGLHSLSFIQYDPKLKVIFTPQLRPMFQ